jgi:DnaA family protein
VQFEVHELRDEGKAQVLQREAQNRGMPLRPEVVSYLLSRNERNLHDLMTTLDTLDSLSLSEKRRMTIPFIREKMHW